MLLRFTTSAFVSVLILAVAGCGKFEATPIQVGSAPTAQSKITLPAPGSDGLAPLDQWPPGCTLLTEADIKAILPQAEKIKLEPRSGDVKITDQFGRPGREDTKKNSGCGIEFSLPKATRDQAVPSVSISATVNVVGTPEVVNLNWPNLVGSNYSKIDSYSADECRSNDSGFYRCRKSGLAITLISNSSTPVVASFENQTGDGRPAMLSYWRQTVVPEFLKAMTAKMP